MTRAGLLLLLTSISCSSPDFGPGHSSPSIPAIFGKQTPVNVNTWPEEPGPWTCRTIWSDDRAWAKYVKKKRLSPCNSCVTLPNVYTDVRTVTAEGPESANLAWWLSWSKDPVSKATHIIEGPSCRPGT